LLSDIISFSDLELPAGSSGELQLSLSNDTILGGFQFQIIDFPDQVYVENVVVTDRTSAFTVSFNEQIDGSVIVVGFDLSGQGLDAGQGSILDLTYTSTGIYTANIDIYLNESQTVLSNLVGEGQEFTVTNGTISILGEDPPPVLPIEGLSAVSGFGEISLSWNDINDNIVDILGYRVYRDGSFINSSVSTNYLDIGLEQVTEYCYTVSAYNASTESDLSDLVCATTLEIYLEEPQNLTASENGLEVSLNWDTPPSAIGIGDDCETETGVPGYIDCSGICFDTGLADTWIGDGFCDGIDAAYGVNFSCSYWSCDGCDCAGLGFNSNECIDECGSFSNAGNNTTNTKEIADGTYFVQSRDLVGYEIYRNNEMIDYVQETEYIDTSEGLWYLEDFCYNIVADYDEGSSGFSNQACVNPQLNAPGSLSAQGTGSFITIQWGTTPEDDQTSFNIYRDNILLSSDNISNSYEDYDTILGQEYCYYATAFYDGIGESPSTNISCTSWNVYPPSQIEATPGDQFVNLSWEEPIGGEEYTLQYDDGILANAFYFNDTYENGLAHGTKFDVGVDFDIMAASVKVISEGDEFWPWPDSTHGPVRVLIFDDIDGFPGNLLYDEEAIAEDGWATVYPGLNGLSGSFYVIASHAEGWTDTEGFGVDLGVDFSDNMFTYYYGVWNTGDILGYGGDYMMASQVLAYGNIENLSSSSEVPSTFELQSDTVISAHNRDLEFSNSSLSSPAFETELYRDLQTYDLYRDGELLINLESNIFSYTDQSLSNMTEYCYALGSTYDEGPSELSDSVCVTPYPGPAASNLIAEDLSGTIGLSWNEAPFDPLFGDILIDYQVYKDGNNIGNSVTTDFIDDGEIIAGVQYCYEVKANYPSGETFATNSACAIYYLSPPVGVDAVGDDLERNITVTWSAPGSFILYNVSCDGGSWQEEVTWELLYDNEIILTGGSPFSQEQVPLFYGDYILNMQDSYGDGWNGNIWNIIDAESNIIASCSLDAGTDGACEFSIGEQAATSDMQTVEAIDNAPLDKQKIVQLRSFDEVSDRTASNISQLLTRDMLAYHVFKDGQFLAETDLNTFIYVDEETNHDQEYCYTVKTIYDDGDSIDSNQSCDQWVLLPPTDFYSSGINGQIELGWQAPISSDVLGYSINRNGEFLAFVEDAEFYNDETAIHNMEYCYTIESVYEIGNSVASNPSCSTWEILPPNGLIANGQDGLIHIEWSEPSSSDCADETIPSLPFNALGSNVGAGDDWLVQGSQGADYA
ncbi:hypothetical protein OAQ87_02460, partial [Candidatus Marinimicrobia bacterium]|nr:hypothetical protein [Candidatus Neomarinimicrobiota bacterium]